MKRILFVGSSLLFVTSICSAQPTEINRIYGDYTDQFLGTVVASLPDLNGDGVPEWAAGGRSAYVADPNVSSVKVVSGLDGSLAFRLGSDPSSSADPGIAKVGDIDSDGIEDIAFADTLSANGAGTVTFFSGATRSIIRTINGNLPSFLGGGEFGNKILNLGDVNGDLVPDTVILPKILGVSIEPSWTGRVVSGATGTTLYSISLTNIYGEVSDVIAVSDVNGDGANEIVLTLYDSIGSRIIMLSGSTGLPLFITTHDLITQLHGFGCFSSVASVGSDLNGDGVHELVVGDFCINNYSGAVYFFDGATGTYIAPLIIGTVQEQFVGYKLAQIGDANADGLPDIAIGAPGSINLPGFVRVMSIFGTINNQFQLGDIKPLDSRNGDGFGLSLSGHADINNDGFAEILIGGSTSLNESGERLGAGYIFTLNPNPQSPIGNDNPTVSGSDIGPKLNLSASMNGNKRLNMKVALESAISETTLNNYTCSISILGSGRKRFIQNRSIEIVSRPILSETFKEFTAKGLPKVAGAISTSGKVNKRAMYLKASLRCDRKLGVFGFAQITSDSELLKLNVRSFREGGTVRRLLELARRKLR